MEKNYQLKEKLILLWIYLILMDHLSKEDIMIKMEKIQKILTIVILMTAHIRFHIDINRIGLKNHLDRNNY